MGSYQRAKIFGSCYNFQILTRKIIFWHKVSKIHVKIVPTSIVSKTLRTQYTLAVAVIFMHCFGALPQNFMAETSRYDIFTYGSQWAVVRLNLQFAEQKPSQQSVLLTVKHPISSPLILIFRKVSCVKVCTTMRHPLMDPSILIC